MAEADRFGSCCCRMRQGLASNTIPIMTRLFLPASPKEWFRIDPRTSEFFGREDAVSNRSTADPNVLLERAQGWVFGEPFSLDAVLRS